MDEGHPHPNLPPQGEGANGRPGRRRIRTRHIAYLALAVAVGHVIYAILRDHVFHGSPILR